MKKKAQGLPMDVIIIAILVILVLVIVSVVVMMRMNIFVGKTSDCELQSSPNYLCTTDSSCRTTSEGESLESYVRETGMTCKKLDDQPRYCCLRLGAAQ